MELGYRMTADEHRRWQGLAQPGLPDELKGLSYLPGVAVTIVVVLALAWLAGSGVIGADAFGLAVAAYALGIGVVSARERLLRRLHPYRRPGDVRLTVDGTGVTNDSVHYRWSAFTGVSEHGDFVLLRRAPGAGTLAHLAIPARAFATAAAKAEFVGLARARIAARSGSAATVPVVAGPPGG